MNTITLGTWSLSTEEIGFYVGRSSEKTSSPSFQVYIPKILPTIKQGPAQVKTEPLTTTGIINDPKCKVTPNPYVETRNYMVVPVSDNISFKRPIFETGAKMKISFVSGNVDSGTIMNTIDSSTFDKKVTTL